MSGGFYGSVSSFLLSYRGSLLCVPRLPFGEKSTAFQFSHCLSVADRTGLTVSYQFR
jgi:hypothetical protein